MSIDDDYWYYEQEEAMEAFLEDSLKNISEDNVRSYLGRNGDAVETRIKDCLRQARELKHLNHFASALTISATAIELILRFLLIRPLVQGAFLSDDWAEILSKRISSGRSVEDRALLPAVLKLWDMDISDIKLANGAALWDTILKHVQPKRNNIVHAGETASKSDAMLSIECAETLLQQVVYPIATKLGFTLETTGKWCEIRGEKGAPGEDGYHSWGQSFVPDDPFKH